jgi:peptidyl-prolyl cis-trans isomerase C
MAFAQATSTPAPAPGQTSPASASNPAKPVGPEAVADHDPNRVVATVDGKQITAKQALDLLKPFPPEQRKQYESNLPNLIQQVYMRVQLADLATQMHMDQQTPWKDQIALAKENVLAQAYLAHLTEEASKGPVQDPQKYYDAHPDEFDQVSLRGIFINFDPPGTPASSAGAGAKTEQQAEQAATEVEKKLKAGGDFSALARAESDNKATAAKGGDLGQYTMGDEKIPAPLRAAIGKLQAGQYSEPVRLQSAFLILKVESRKRLPYADVSKSLEQRLKTEQSQNIVKQEIDKYKIKVDDPDFFESPSAHAVPTLRRPVSAPAQPSPEK